MRDLMVEFLNLSYPIKRMRVANKTLQYHNLPSKGNFKRVIYIHSGLIFRVSDKDERYSAMYALSKILCNVFRVSQEETIPIIKIHLHII